MLTDQGPHDLTRFAGRELFGVAGEYLLSRLGRAEQHKRRILELNAS